MAYALKSPVVGAQPIAETSDTAKHPLGFIVEAYDPTYGHGEFIYLPGVADTAVGSVVTYNTTSWTTALAPIGTNLPQPIAVAMSANVADQYGWYQISGIAVAKKNNATATFNAGVAVGISGTGGWLSNTATGVEVQGAIVAAVATATATSVAVMINRPHMQGRVT